MDRPALHRPSAGRREGELAHYGGMPGAGDRGEGVGQPGQETVTHQGKGHRLLGVAVQPQILLGAHLDAVSPQPPGQGGHEGGVVAAAAAGDQLGGLVAGQDIPLIGVGNRPGGELGGGGRQIVKGEAVLLSVL